MIYKKKQTELKKRCKKTNRIEIFTGNKQNCNCKKWNQ